MNNGELHFLYDPAGKANTTMSLFWLRLMLSGLSDNFTDLQFNPRTNYNRVVSMEPGQWLMHINFPLHGDLHKATALEIRAGHITSVSVRMIGKFDALLENRGSKVLPRVKQPVAMPANYETPSGVVYIGLGRALLRSVEEIRKKAPPATTNPTVQLAGFVEKSTTYEDIGSESRTLVNASRSKMSRSFRASREWVRSWHLGDGSKSSDSWKAKVGPGWANLEASVGSELQRTYSITGTEREEYSEEVQVDVAPQSQLVLTLNWKRVWLNGVAQVSQDGSTIEVPYRIARGLTFDQHLTEQHL
ncbi:hypothetical protein [Pseudonocardia xishanensis]|uniref:Uncharacterized protein n=1 Tax=Pseudonocardia xishanensis TaxID=630995 RepID=A0ABP8RXS4_9PSEU